MNLILSIGVGLREILAHKFRSFLTMFGIILGVASLVSMFATVEGMTRGMREYLQRSGGIERISVIDQDVPVGQEDLKDMSPGRTMKDVEAIRRDCPLVGDISPEVELGGPALQIANKTTRGRVQGVMPSFLEVNRFGVERGRFITDLDLDRSSMVCVIGWPAWEQLEQSRDDNPVGRTLKINDVPFQIVGVFRDFETEYERRMRESGKLAAQQLRAQERRSSATGKGRGPMNRRWNYSTWKNNVVVIPLSTMQATFKSASLVLAGDNRGPDPKLNGLNVQAKDPLRLSETVDQIKAAMLKSHRGVEDFGFNTQEEWAENIETTVKATRLSGAIIAGISLLVGGIGIANIMLASISERVREIGIRMAVGAKRRDIFLQILVESTVLGFLGGTLGIAASFGVVEIIKRVAELGNEPVIPLYALAVSFFFAVLTGILAGIYPALKASRLDPIQALRYE